MSDYLTQLENIDQLESEIIKKTKVNKVLKAIIKLERIPMEEDFNFKPRSTNLLARWNSILAADGESTAPAASAEPATNGIKHEEEKKKSDGEKDEPSVEKLDINDKKSDGPSSTEQSGEKDGDVTMVEADKEDTNRASSAQGDAESSKEDADGTDQKVDKETTATEATAA